MLSFQPRPLRSKQCRAARTFSPRSTYAGQRGPILAQTSRNPPTGSAALAIRSPDLLPNLLPTWRNLSASHVTQTRITPHIEPGVTPHNRAVNRRVAGLSPARGAPAPRSGARALTVGPAVRWARRVCRGPSHPARRIGPPARGARTVPSGAPSGGPEASVGAGSHPALQHRVAVLEL